ncbi:MAG: DUF2007 domain-containing protein [Tannerella sp.]|nr:DUF2007 domain-containing protein [Tannerella sp.]
METIVLTALCDSFQVNMLKDILLNEGIESFVRHETLSSVFSNIPGFQIEILVFEKDYEKAREIFEKGFPQLVEK